MNDTATILLVEDDASILNGMADLLQLFDIGYEVRVLKASDGMQGLARMAENVPDLIISDIMMPRLNGFEFLGKVRENPAWVHIPFIFLTAKGKKQDILEGRRSGAELYITKPFVSSELLELVKSQLDRTFQLQRARQQRLGVLKRNLLQLLNHEFRTPLTYVTAYYDMLADSIVNVDDPLMLQDYLRGIQVGCVRLTNLVEDLIKIMEIRTAKAAAAFREHASPITQIGELFKRRGEKFEARARQAGIAIEYDIQPALPVIFGDIETLATAIDCLLDNAIKFTQARPDGPRIVRLIADVYDGSVRLCVQDSGIGFPPAIRDQLFDLFFQYNREMLEQQGSGSGLTIVKGYVELHRGQIVVESEERVGSTFTIFLPPAGASRDTGQSTTEERRRPATILIVEDDVHLLEGLSELMEMAQSPYELTVVTAMNGQDGLRMLEQHAPDLIISDVMMPVMGGYDFLERVRANAAWLQIPFIFLTAKGEHEDVHRGRRSGVEEYVTKPYDIDELMDLTVTQLDRYFQRQGAVNQSFEALKRSILSMLQPDIRGPLDLVTSYSEKLAGDLESIQTDEDLVDSLHVIQESSERLTRLVEDFITMAEFRTGEADAAFRMRAMPENSIGLVFYEAAYVMQFEDDSGPFTFSYDLAAATPAVLCERERLQDLFRRLLNYLVEFRASEHEPVHVHVAATGDDDSATVALTVSNVMLPQHLALQKLDDVDQADGGGANGMDPAWMVIQSIILLHEGVLSTQSLEEKQVIINLQFPAYSDPEALRNSRNRSQISS